MPRKRKDIQKPKILGDDVIEKTIRFDQLLIDIIPAPIFYKDTSGFYLGGNKAFEQYLGLSLEQIIGKTVYDITSADLAEKYDKADRELLNNPGIQTYEASVVYADGSRHDVIFNKSTFTDAEDKVAGIMGVILDITERKQAEEELIWKTAFLEAQTEAIIDGILVVDKDNRIILANQNLLDMWKVPQHIRDNKDDALLLRYVTSITAYPDQFLGKVEYLYKHPDETSRDEVTFKDGTVLDRYSSPVSGKDGKYYGRIWIFHDVTDRNRMEQINERMGAELQEKVAQRTLELKKANQVLQAEIAERKKAEEALREREERYRTVADFTYAWEYLIASDGNYIYVSPSCERISGYTLDEFQQDPHLMEKITHPDDRHGLAVHIHDVLHGKSDTCALEFRIITRNNEERWIGHECQEVRGRGGEYLGRRGSNRDITDHKRAEIELRENEERFRQLFDHMADGVAIYQAIENGKDFIIVDINRIAQQLSKISHGDAVGKRVTEAFPGVEKIGLLDVFREVWRTGEAQDHPVSLYEDERIQQWVKNYVFKLPSGLIAALYSDISEKHRAEEALRESEKKYRNIFDNSVGGIFQSTPEGKFLSVNPAMAEMCGYSSPREMMASINDIGSQFYVHAEEREKFKRRLEEHGIDEKFEHQVFRKDGSTIWVSTNSRAVRDDSGRIVYFEGTHEYITERKRAEEALKASESLYRLLADNMTDAVWLMDLNLNTTYVSPSVEKMRGYTWEEIRQLPLDKHLTPASLQLAMKIYSEERVRVLADPAYFVTPTVELEFYRKDGATYWSECTFNLIRDETGKPVSILGESRNITERKQAEKEKVKLQEQLIQSQKMESVGRLAGGVAHDFNNMLSVIIGHAELATENIDPAHPLNSDLQEIRKAAERSAVLTRQLLAFARKQTVSPKVLDVNETMAGMLKMLQRLIGEDIQLTWRPGSGLWQVEIDPSQVDQILANLCVNARDAIAGVGNVIIETGNIALAEAFCADHMGSVPGEYILLTVSDDGCGMDKDVLSKLFEPFFTTKGVGKGTGLGLATVYGIVKQNNGFIDVTSKPKQGSTFRIYLPRHIGKGKKVHAEETKEPVNRGYETVLLVEDELAILNIGERMLEKQGYRVLTAGTPGDAIRKSEEHDGEIHLLVTDVVMPEMNGRELAQKLYSLYPHMKYLFMSGYTTDVIARGGVLDDGLNFIQKPFSGKDLAAKVREVLDTK